MATYKLVDGDKLDADLTTVADAIRAKTGGKEPLSFPEGMAGEVDAVFEAGKKSERDAFWDALQQEGKRTNYEGAFAHGWNDDVFCPKYDFIPNNCSKMFASSTIINLKEKLEQNEIIINTVNCGYFLQMFQSSNITHVPELDLRKATNINYMFGSDARVETIDNLIVSETTPFSKDVFGGVKLRDISFEGTIGTSIWFQYSPLLTKSSILSILNALSDTTTGLTVTLSLTAVNTAFETTAGAADGSTSEEWAALIATKTNWTISLA